MAARARYLRWLAWASLAVIVAGWFTIAVLGDRFWIALPVLYGPRWVWALVLAGVLPYLIALPRRGCWIAAIATLIVLFGICDWRLGLARWSAPTGPLVRVVTLNAGAGSAPPQRQRIVDEIRRLKPAIVVVTECGGGLPGTLQAMTDYHVRVATMTQLCLLTTGTVVSWAERDPADAWKQYGSAAIVRIDVALPQGTVRVGMVHLATPRNALQDFLDLSEILKLGPETRANTIERGEESAHAIEWIEQGAPLPTIVTGDFNLPIESAIYRRYWAGYRNAFSEVGWGTGYTKHTRLWGIRIDHVLTSRDIRPVRSFVGRDVGSDHLPLAADLALPRDQRTSTAR